MQSRSRVGISQFARGPLPGHLSLNATRTLELVNAVLAEMPELRFSSGYRSATRNAQVGGVSNSKHVQALAADFVTADGRYPQALLERFKAIATPRGYNAFVHDVGSGWHIHSEYRGNTITKSDNTALNLSFAGQASTDNRILIGIGILLIFALTAR